MIAERMKLKDVTFTRNSKPMSNLLWCNKVPKGKRNKPSKINGIQHHEISDGIEHVYYQPLWTNVTTVHHRLTSSLSSAIINTWQTNSFLSSLLASSLVIMTPTMSHNVLTLVSLTNHANTFNWLFTPTACWCIAGRVCSTHAWRWAYRWWLHTWRTSWISQSYVI